ncbi:SMI1/KNR4 family protein [Paenibacillus radicis (ex Xue et al. 2023)]|uniref:SMI1/KNR4 family protein n=1 Tax=Paenibacillus radicis (ex Xue et al. 2023) TaxID=2972489 RepID=A0ABT1YCG1_9BACL|nr:SMI1/KNR4 family protein [Paenibacillus radicis (ex Xue et al. 2023)]MCR8630886.1 SMI1/KNR4 family protein [Paenibacillus radicis (ex Xue et al. 2023)]
MNIEFLVKKLKTMPDNVIYSPSGLPFLEGGVALPSDLTSFYQLCGGGKFFTKSDHSISIVSPKEFVLANPVIVGDRCEDDISSGWYIIGSDNNGDYLTIDLHKERLGKCYDSFWDRHGVVGDCPVIAHSFTHLLIQLIENSGHSWYWLKDDFESLGDAYDSANQ